MMTEAQVCELIAKLLGLEGAEQLAPDHVWDSLDQLKVLTMLDQMLDGQVAALPAIYQANRLDRLLVTLLGHGLITD